MKSIVEERIRTKSIYEKLCGVIPGGVNSPVRACRAVEQMPLVAASAKGSMIYDVDGRGYIDYCGSWGPLIHGHAHAEVIQAISDQLSKGTTYGTTSEVELQLAEKVVELMPHMEKVRFVSSGTEAAMSAIRLARGFTGRDVIIKFGGHYHGHADCLLVKAGSGVMDIADSTSKGVPKEFVRHTKCLLFNDCEGVKKILRNIKAACVILEPIAGNMGVVPACDEFIKTVREETEKNGALLIFDEVMTGFRVAKGGAASLYGITPDLTCLGKVVGGGLPAAAFGGRKEIMDMLAPLGPVYQAGTLSGNPLAMRAGLKTLEILDRPGFYEELKRKTGLLLDPIKEHIVKNSLNCCIQQAGSMFTLFFGRKSVLNHEDALALDFGRFTDFFQTLFNQGIYIPPLQQEAWFISMAHSDNDIRASQKAIFEYLYSVYNNL